MIELPPQFVPNGAEVSPLDFGFILRPQTGAEVLRIDKPGGRYVVKVSFPPMRPDDARVLTLLLELARTEGLRIEMPLLDVSQGSPGAPVVNGAGQTGTTLNVRGLTAGYLAKQGYWLTLVRASTGKRYLHRVRATGRAAADGTLALAIVPPLRAPFADGDAVLLGKPVVEGWLVDDLGWTLTVEHLVQIGGMITIEEAA